LHHPGHALRGLSPTRTVRVGTSHDRTHARGAGLEPAFGWLEMMQAKESCFDYEIARNPSKVFYIQ